MTVNNKILADVLAMLAIGLIVVIGYRLSPLLLPKADITASPEPGCDLHRQACAAALPEGGRLELSIVPRPIPMVAPLQVEVKISGAAPHKVEVDFAGVDMNMGYNRPALAAAGAGLYRGEATLPVCVTGKMTWQASVLIETERSRIAVPFRFISAPG